MAARSVHRGPYSELIILKLLILASGIQNGVNELVSQSGVKLTISRNLTVGKHPKTASNSPISRGLSTVLFSGPLSMLARLGAPAGGLRY